LFRKILVALHKSLILVLTTSILLSVNSCLSDQILSFTDVYNAGSSYGCKSSGRMTRFCKGIFFIGD
ncbi:MAG: hypothetical protein O7150_02035, partial [Wolbachia endosymbiont of Andrena praecox]|nr:hypothetical protein [Wolbachia endosymbiont of Andrena praecox]MDX5509868.1 hypothetical protein [Wolbachia endosymbiont of Lasioglossum morio]MDX5561648.1 hypothetical protein [Wolbachia endosymbiont of Andrena bicolor]MDX5596577.1 hypothetical protein [Wolbachia endosymbiont of Andrena labialis]